jgi:hypothetical protein
MTTDEDQDKMGGACDADFIHPLFVSRSFPFFFLFFFIIPLYAVT